jgi:hypothetical protein
MEIEIKYDTALTDPKEIEKRIEKINAIVVDIASSYYIEKAKKSRCVK